MSRGAQGTPFGLHLALRSTDDNLKGTPRSGYRINKIAAMNALEENLFESQLTGLVGLVVCLEMIEMGVVFLKIGMASEKFVCTLKLLWHQTYLRW